LDLSKYLRFLKDEGEINHEKDGSDNNSSGLIGAGEKNRKWKTPVRWLECSSYKTPKERPQAVMRANVPETSQYADIVLPGKVSNYNDLLERNTVMEGRLVKISQHPGLISIRASLPSVWDLQSPLRSAHSSWRPSWLMQCKTINEYHRNNKRS